MAKLPFIEDEARSRTSGFGGANTGAGAVGRSVQQLAATTGGISDEIIRKRENDRIMEERASAARFAVQESLYADELLNGAETSDQINTLEERFDQDFDQRFTDHVVNDIGIEEGSERFLRMRDYYSRNQGLTVRKGVLGGIAKKNATFFLDQGQELIDERRKAIIANPALLESFLTEGSVFDGLSTPSGVDQQKLNGVRDEEFATYAFDSGMTQIEDAVSVGELQDLRDAIFDDEGLYFPNLSADGLDKLDNAIDSRINGLAVKSKAVSKAYIRQLANGHGEIDPLKDEMAIEAGLGDHLDIAKRSYGNIQELSQVGPAEWNQVLQEHEAALNTDNPEAYTIASTAMAAVQRNVRRLQQQLNDDAYSYVLQYNPSLGQKAEKINKLLREGDTDDAYNKNQELVSEVLARQQELGLSSAQQRVVPANAPIRDVLNNAIGTKDPAQSIALAVDTFEGMYGDFVGRATAELGDDMPDAVLSVMMSNKEAYKELAASSANMTNQTLNESIDARFDLIDGADKVFSDLSSDYAPNIYAAHVNEFGGGERAARFIGILKRQAKVLMVTGRAETPEKAMEKAYEDMFESSLQYTPVGNGNVVRIPRDPEYDADMIKLALDTMVDDIDSTGIPIEPLPARGELAGLTEQQRLTRTKQLIESNLVFATRPDNSGVDVYLSNGDELVPLPVDENLKSIFTFDWADLEDTGSFLNVRGRNATSPAIGATPDKPAIPAGASP